MKGVDSTTLDTIDVSDDTECIVYNETNGLGKATLSAIKAVWNTILEVATTTAKGLMSAADKTNLDALVTNIGTSRTVETAATKDSTNLISSGGVYTSLNEALAEYCPKGATVQITLAAISTDTQIDVSTLGFTPSPKLHVCGITALHSANNRYLQLSESDITISTQYISDSYQTLRYTVLNSNYAGQSAYVSLSY